MAGHQHNGRTCDLSGQSRHQMVLNSSNPTLYCFGLKSLGQLCQYRFLTDAIKRAFKLSDTTNVIELLWSLPSWEPLVKRYEARYTYEISERMANKICEGEFALLVF